MNPKPRTRAFDVYAECVKPLATEDLEHILTHTRPLWEEARGRRVFLSGGTGFFGAWLLESLVYCNRRLNLDLSATVLSRNPEAFRRRMPHLPFDDSVRTLYGDVRNFAFPQGNFEFAIHAAAPTTEHAACGPQELLDVLQQGTRRMLEFSRMRGAKKFLFASSGAVYGQQPDSLTHIPEEYLPGPGRLGPYGEGKQVAERICSTFAQDSKIDVTIARCFSFVGPHLPLNRHFAIGNFVSDALAGRNITIRGDGTTLRSYLYGADLAIWFWTLLFRAEQSSSKPSAFNVGSGDAISILDLAQLVARELDPSLKIELAQEPVPASPRLRYVPDVRKAEVCLGLRPTVGLREAIRRTAAWYR